MPKILLVDDVRAFLDLEISFLRRAECKVITAMDGLEALKLTKKEKPDLIFLDIEMPRMTGIEVLRIIKNDPELKDTPVVMVTALDKEDEAMRAGADEFLKKPVYEKDILQMVKKYVGIPEREEERISVSLPALVKLKGKKIKGYTRDLSRMGAFIIIRDIIPVGSEVEVELELPNNKKIKAFGTVARDEREDVVGQLLTGIGIAFTRFGGSGKKELSEFIKKHLT